MKPFIICLCLFVLQGCSHRQYQIQQAIGEDLLKALYNEDTIKVKQLISDKVDNGIPAHLFKYYVTESHNLLNKYGLPQKNAYNLLIDKNDPNLIEFEVPILNEQQKKIATIQIFFAKFLPENRVYFFRLDGEVFDKHMTEAPKEK